MWHCPYSWMFENKSPYAQKHNKSHDIESHMKQKRKKEKKLAQNHFWLGKPNRFICFYPFCTIPTFKVYFFVSNTVWQHWTWLKNTEKFFYDQSKVSQTDLEKSDAIIVQSKRKKPIFGTRHHFLHKRHWSGKKENIT